MLRVIPKLCFKCISKIFEVYNSSAYLLRFFVDASFISYLGHVILLQFNFLFTFLKVYIVLQSTISKMSPNTKSTSLCQSSVVKFFKKCIRVKSHGKIGIYSRLNLPALNG